MDPGNQKNKDQVNQAPEEKKHETLDEIIHRHLTDKNDIITEEDLRDVIIGEEIVPPLEDDPGYGEELPGEQ